MSIFLRAVVTGFGMSLGSAIYKRVSKKMGLDDGANDEKGEKNDAGEAAQADVPDPAETDGSDGSDGSDEPVDIVSTIAPRG